MRSQRVGLHVWEIAVKGGDSRMTSRRGNVPASEHYLSAWGAFILLPLHPTYGLCLAVFKHAMR